MEAPRSPLLPAVIESITARLAAEPTLQAAFLHGSVLTANFRPNSDIDVALLLERKASLPAADRLKLAADLEALCGRPVDLGILTTANLVYAKEVVAHGRPLVVKNPAITAEFLGRILSLYADFQFTRRKVLDAYAA